MLDFFAREIRSFLRSERRKAQLDAARYLAGRHDILNRARTVIGRDGLLEESRNLPNNRLVDNQFGKLVRQKVNYLAGNPFTVNPPELAAFFTLRRRKTVRSALEDAVACGTGWLAPGVDASGNPTLRRLPPYEVLPFWADSDHTVLDCAIRVFDAERFLPGFPGAPGRRRTVTRAELYTPQGVSRFVLDGERLVPDDCLPSGPWLTVNEKKFGFGATPLVAFKSPGEQPLLERVKTLQDALNTLISDYQNALQEDARNTILVLKNYDGGDLAEFRRNLAAYGAVKVRTVDNSQGGVETLRVDTSHEGFLAMANLLKGAIVENGMGFDVRDGTLRGAPNQMTLLALYSDIELDAHGLESEWQASFCDLLSFVRSIMLATGKSVPPDAETGVSFNRDLLLNESSIMRTLLDAGLKLSNESLLEQVPWVRDAKSELKRLKKEEAFA